MANDRCPWCGAEAEEIAPGKVRYKCLTYLQWRSEQCLLVEKDALRARVTTLEEALRGLLHNMKQHNCAGCHIEKAREALSDTHGPGTLAGDAAREGLKR